MQRACSSITLLFVLVCAVLPAAHAQTVSGVLGADTTWSSAAPITVTGTVTIPSGVTLTIQPGAVIRFSAGTGLLVAGGLSAAGTAVAPILFTAAAGTPAAGGWNGIEFQNTLSVGSTFRYCRVEYAGGGSTNAAIFYKTGAFSVPLNNTVIAYSGGNGVNTRASSPAIKNSEFVSNAGYGIYSDLLSNSSIDSCIVHRNGQGGIRIAVNSTPSITNTAIDSNGVGIFVDNGATPTIQKNLIRWNTTGIQLVAIGSSQPSITGNVIAMNTQYGFINNGSATVLARYNDWGSNLGPYHAALNPTGTGNACSNGVDFVPWIQGGPALSVVSVTTDISGTVNWPPAIYWIKNNVTLASGAVLTIQPGAIIKLANGIWFRAYGTMRALGTQDSLIVFTSDKDDSYGGDSNGDGTATLPSRGIWDKLQFEGAGSSASVLNYCVVRYGGANGYGNIYCNNSTASFSHVYSNNSNYYGVYTYNASASFTDCVFSGNGQYGIIMTNNGSTLTRCTVNDNGRDGLRCDGWARTTIRSSSFLRNTWDGIHFDGGGNKATLVLLDSSVVSFNKGAGVYAWYGSGAQRFTNNTFEGNGTQGLWCLNIDTTVTIVGNKFLNNTDDGLVTSRASVVNNQFQGNKFSFSLIGNVNSSFAGNTIAGSQYPNAIGLRVNRVEESLNDTLKLPSTAGFPSNVYNICDMGGTYAVASGLRLVITPGVILKFNQDLGFRVDGTLVAQGTPEQPIVFTSWRDAVYGGKTNLATDNTAPAPGNWSAVFMRGVNAVNSSMNNCIMRYGGSTWGGMLYIENCGTMTNAFSNVRIFKSSTQGMRLYGSILSAQSFTIDSCSYQGVYLDYNSEMSLQNFSVTANARAGLHAEANAAFRLVANSAISRNAGNGIEVLGGTIPQTFSGNSISFNTDGGIYNRSDARPAADIRYLGNTISDHPNEGIVSTRSTYIDNTFLRNRYAIAVIGRTGNSYVDGAGNDGNIFTDNVYNNAIAIRAGQLADTLTAVFPKAVTSGTYVVLEDVYNNTPFVIQPGVIIKFQPMVYSYYHWWYVDAPLIADGTPEKPIIFTSWRDQTVGGKTNLPGDNAGPAAGDWQQISFRSGSAGSILRNVEIRYSGRDRGSAIRFHWTSGITVKRTAIRKSLDHGIALYASSIAFDSVTVDSSAHIGVLLEDHATTLASLNGCSITASGTRGIQCDGQAQLSSLTNSTISGSGGIGVYAVGNTIPLSIVGNTISDNGDHGLYLRAVNNAVDTLMIIGGNTIRRNKLVGVFSSRAHIVDNVITNNRYAVGVTGQISLDGSPNNAGNVYRGNTITGNTFNDVLVAEETTYGRLGLSFPQGYTSRVVAIRGNLYVPSGTFLSIAPGTVVKFPVEYGSGEIGVDGTFKADGLPSNKIVFTSWRDDTYGGDANADSNATVPGPGNWRRIHLNGATNDSSIFRNVILRYGGADGFGMLDINNCRPLVDSCFVSYASYHGMRVLNAATPVISNSEIHDNGTGIHINNSTGNPVIHFCNFYRNGTGLQSYSTSTVQAQNNYWGDATGPFVNTGSDQNLTGKGDKIVVSSGSVAYRPFYFSRSGILLGDASGNGLISAYDAALVLRHTVGFDTLRGPSLTAADVSGNGQVTAYDASLILQYVVGMISGFPGLGKTSGAPLAEAFDLTLQPGTATGEFAAVLKLSKASTVFAGQMTLTFNGDLLEAVAVRRGTQTGAFSLESSMTRNAVTFSMASAVPADAAGELAVIVFKARRPLRGGTEAAIAVPLLMLNETDLTPLQKTVMVSEDRLKGIPETYGLEQNYPNPFNPSTAIEYRLPQAGRVTVTVYNSLGESVRTLVAGDQAAGYHTVVWNGTEATGRTVSSGLYFYRLTVQSEGRQAYTAVRKMMFVK